MKRKPVIKEPRLRVLCPSAIRPKVKKSVFKVMYDWQKEAFKLRDIQWLVINTVSGAGKSMLVVWYALHELFNSNRKVVISIPQQQISKTFTKEGKKEGICVRWRGKNVTWRVGINLCNGSEANKIDRLKEFLMSPAKNTHRNGLFSGASWVFSGASCVVTHSALVRLWEDLDFEERLIAIKNTSLYIDEGHHVTANYNEEDHLTDEEMKNMTQLGLLCRDILQMNEDCPELNSRLRYLTATFYRGDNKAILSKKAREKFKIYTLDWVKHYKELGIKEFIFEFVTYKDSPLKQIARQIAEEPREYHLYLNPATNDSFNKDGKALQKFKRFIKGILTQETVADLVEQRRGRHRVMDQALSNPGNYHLIMACRLFDEGTDWVPCNRIYTPIIRSITRLVQIVGRSFRRYEDKNSVKVRIYIRSVPGSNKEKIREMFSDYFNAHQAAFLIDVWYRPIKLPLVSSSEKIDIKELFGDSFVKLHAELVERFEFMPPENKVDPELVDRAIRKVLRNYEIPDIVSKEDVICGLKTMLLRSRRIAESNEVVIDLDKPEMINPSFIREEGFDKIWTREPFRGSLIFGTKEPFSPEEWGTLRGIIRERIGHECEIDEEVKKAEAAQIKKAGLPDVTVSVVDAPEIRDLTGRWVKFSLTSGLNYGIIIDAFDSRYRVKYYEGVEYKEETGEIFYKSNGNVWFCQGDYWRPAGTNKDSSYHTVSKKIRKHFLKDSDIFRVIEIQKDSILRVLPA